MGKKNKKKLADKLARKRGRRTAESRMKRKKPPKVSKKSQELNDDERRAAEAALMRSPLLLSSPELDPISLDSERLTEYLEDVKSRGVDDSQEFLSRGLRELADEELLSSVKLGLTRFIESHREEDPEFALSASLVLSLMDRMEDLSSIPFFVVLFVREVKKHPMVDDPVVWKLVSPYLPSRIVTPETEPKPTADESRFEKSKEYPHLILPSEYKDEE